MTGNRKKLIAVVGPTAVGKTAMAIRLAQHFNTEILSADSRQFYREMSIGTAKPSEEELEQAKHHFIDSHSIATAYSAGDYERDALALLKGLFETRDIVVMVGGSGLFVRALCEGLDDLPRAPAEVRETLNKLYEEQGIAALQEKLRLLDPSYFQSADVQNPQRVIRALEVIDATGLPFSSFHGKMQSARPFDIITVGLHMEREQLYERINQRVDQMMADGLLEEVRTLLAYRDKPALLTVGYAELFAYLDGDITLEEAVARIKQNTRRYAKRQITWFKKYGNTQWFTSSEWGSLLRYIEEK
ncbi:tRNA (adenosine(37)-N6)-dimethylallyltransferase MiaA [Sphingobacterium paludis]|uniref:tRNA dimethylallyltransferase n=1 Tax=Sphingobacterium paludis TaxID=1476465 RepID=A0A4R7CYC4_9SPHI|nr:tRNA (adenosine(37)-N6)-dimethylallyltransferase MiaA [Sphingobacterium paludis]TDS11124.1 tRNA dimethylallyltransferase [Sphingobacterium paludis]